MQQPATDSLVGALIDGRYRVLSRLARGGMSTVYLASDTRLDRNVALKVLYPYLAEDHSFLERFEREAKSAARLSHPHVVGVYDQGIDGNVAYLAMEYVRGHTLRDLLNESAPLTPRHALAVLDPVIEGLAAAHTAGLVHRDIKPENVLMSDDGRIKVGDFGLARAVTTSTSTGTLIGTVAYLPPELVTGTAADERSDVYSVGIMLFEMLTGRQPFTGDVPIQVAFQHVNSTVPAPSTLVPGLAADLDELVLWCTGSDPDQRPVDATALLGELRHVHKSLSDAQLDLQTAPASEAGTSATEVIASDPHRTTVISRPTQHTQIFSAGEAAAAPAGEQQPLSARESKKRQRELSRSARRPEQNLRRGNPRRRGVIWIVVLAILAALVAAAGWFFGMGPGALVSVPDVAGKPAAEAQSMLQEQGLEYRLQEVFDEKVAKGIAVGTEPDAPIEVRRFEHLALVVSKGPELFAVPPLAGMTLEKATDALDEANLTAGKVKKAYDEDVAAGTVLSHKPAEGEQLRRGTAVELTVSKGPKPFDVPQVIGQPQGDAAAALEGAGLKVEIAPEAVFDRNVPEGSVASQAPAEGQVIRGDTVTLTLSKGPRMVEVPDMVGMQVDDAERQLKELGFEVEVNEILGGFFGTVRAQDPVNESVPEGSVITLTVV
ncbi:MAG: Stk1 family PASTA domain-containing Ser/Thr kinase [Actinomycetota bacterium]